MLRIGRAEFGFDGGTTLDRATLDGDTLTISGVIHAPDAESPNGAIQRTQGLVGSMDETVVPVVWDSPGLTGFYRVISGGVDLVKGLTPVGFAPYSLTLERVTGYAAPLVESIVLGAQRADAVATGQAYLALPSTVKGFEIGANLTPNFYSRTGSDGLTVFVDGSNTLYDAAATYYLSPSDWYIGAATLAIENQVQVGRQVRNVPTDWVIDNGLMRVGHDETGLYIQRWDESAGGLLPEDTLYPSDDLFPWLGDEAGLVDRRGVRPYRRIDVATFNYLEAPHTITVRRNTPGEVAIRLTYDTDSAISGARFAAYVDISLRRGSQIAALRLSTRGSYEWGFEVADWGSTFTALTGGGYYAGVTLGLDTSGSLGAGSSHPATSAWTQALASTGLIAGLGYYGAASGGTGGTAIDTPQAVVNQWAAAQSERVDVVVR